MIEAHRRVHRVLLVDDHAMVRQGVRTLLESTKNFEICGEAAGEAEALRLMRSEQPDLVTVDLSLADGTGLDLVTAIHEGWDKVRVVVMSVHDDPAVVERVLRAGAHAYVGKHDPPGEILNAVREVLRGGIYVPDWIEQHLLNRAAGRGPMSDADRLTDRELQVFEMIGRGLGPMEIADRLSRSIKTIEACRMRIRRKLEVPDNAKLILRAATWLERHSTHS